MATRRKKTGRKTTHHRKTRKKSGSSVKAQIQNVIKNLQTIKKHV